MPLPLVQKLPLCGFYRVRPNQPGFAIPIFEATGRLVVQRSENHDRIDGFIPCELDLDQLLPTERAGLERGAVTAAQGEPPLFAFQRSNGRIAVGPKAVLEPVLREELAQLESRPFLTLEIARHLGDPDLVETALARTQALLTRAVSPMTTWEAPPSLVCESAATRSILNLVRRVAPTNATVLLTGETGTGKELIAKLLHTLSQRAKAPFVKISCSELPRELIETYLFGSVKGAFTGAHADREGLFQQADGGTILLDEVADLSFEIQGRLLRVLQDRIVIPVGGRAAHKLDVRVIAATNRDLADAVRKREFREDLYYRLNVVPLHLPPLRERVEDIMPLADELLKRYASETNRHITGFTDSAVELLRSYDWPGNVRQMENSIYRAVLLSEGPYLDAVDFKGPNSPIGAGVAMRGDAALSPLEDVERDAIIRMLKETGGNRLEVARRLGIGREVLYEKLKNYGINT